MLCEARVALSDWPLGDRRDVDPANEKIRGLLRAGFIVGLSPARVRAPQPAEEENTQEPAAGAEKPSGSRKRASAKPDGQ